MTEQEEIRQFKAMPLKTRLKIISIIVNAPRPIITSIPKRRKIKQEKGTR